ncbi:MAG: Gfo/Idh/MocA family oxidoreductase [Oscillospiraceae bacterium]|nr:Gfo/Idh/MocA family oxidoreductase [Oscillospiraceae bacterium]
MFNFNSSSKVRIGIIGCGGIANGKHLPALTQIPNVEIVAYCDINEEAARRTKSCFGPDSAAVYVDYRKLLEDKSIDVVHVLTPNRHHSYISVEAMEAGKHVMCEKPMATSYEEAKKMVDTAKRTGKLLTIGYQNRQTNEALYLKSEADSGTFGDMYFAKATAIRRRAVPNWGVFLNEYEQGGGPLIDIGTHALDLTLWTMNNYKPKYCMGTTYHKLNNERNSGNAWGDWDPDKFTVEDSAFGFVVMENGATIILESSWALNTVEVREAVTMVCGTKGGGDTWDGVRINGVRNGRQFITRPDMSAGGVAFYNGVSEKPQDREAAQWIDAVINGKTPCVLPEQACCVTQILEGIYKSAASGKAYNFI